MPCSREPISGTVKRGRDENKSLFYRYWKWANPTLGNPISEMTRNETVDSENKTESVTNSGKVKNIFDSPQALPRLGHAPSYKLTARPSIVSGSKLFPFRPLNTRDEDKLSSCLKWGCDLSYESLGGGGRMNGFEIANISHFQLSLALMLLSFLMGGRKCKIFRKGVKKTQERELRQK